MHDGVSAVCRTIPPHHHHHPVEDSYGGNEYVIRVFIVNRWALLVDEDYIYYANLTVKLSHHPQPHTN